MILHYRNIIMESMCTQCAGHVTTIMMPYPKLLFSKSGPLTSTIDILA